MGIAGGSGALKPASERRLASQDRPLSLRIRTRSARRTVLRSESENFKLFSGRILFGRKVVAWHTSGYAGRVPPQMNEGLGEVWSVRANVGRNSHLRPYTARAGSKSCPKVSQCPVAQPGGCL